ncbi:MAG: hypothetical protein ACT4NL_05915 [Pseudomarimonas sp.]
MRARPHLLWQIALLALLLASMAGHGQDVESTDDVAYDSVAQTPVRQPLAAWLDARASLEKSITIRRIAFAAHGLFVFHSAAGQSTINATFFSEQDGRYVGEDSGPRERSLCLGSGVAPAEVAPALRVLLASKQWREHSERLDSLILECSRIDPFWTLMPVPEGGFREGVAIETFDVPFSVSRTTEGARLKPWEREDRP